MSDTTKEHRTADTSPQSDDDAGAARPSPPITGSGRQFGQPTERSRDFGSAVRRTFARLRQENFHIFGIVVLAVVAVSLQVVGPKLLGQATDIIVDGVTGDGIDFPALHVTLGVAAGLYLASAGLTYLQAWLLTAMIQRSMSNLRAEVEAKLNRLPLSYVDRTARGDLLSRVTNDIDNMAQSLQQTLSQLLTGVLTIVGVLAMMFWISPLLASVAVIVIPLSLVMMRFVTARSKVRFVDQWRHTGRLNALVEESITGHAVVKAFGRQEEVEERFRVMNEDLYEASFGAQFISGTVMPAMMFLGNLNFVVVAVVGGVRVASGQLTIGDIQAFIQYARQFTMPLTQLASMVNVFQSGIASAERVFELLDAEEEPSDADLAPREGDPAGRVDFEDVSFAYSADRPLIQHFSFAARPGETVAIVGPTGAGKTTLVNLLMRFYDVDEGRITVDGRDIRDLRRADLRSMMGMVLQDTWLFGGTIRENIAYGDPEASEERLQQAAKATYVDRFVRALPDGYDTVLDDQHGTVSAGEMQLLTIARAFLADPAILILDEATSSVDTRTEVLVQEAMNALRRNRTSFVIAHRLSTIRDADTILVMEDGQIVEQGDHDELLEADGAYARLYNAQFAGAATEVA
ncbi:MAG TPA: ABC transporter ATP-binding protein [Acidimicrobiales bacterium]